GINVDYFVERLGFDALPQLPAAENEMADAGRLPSLRAFLGHECLSKPYWRIKRVLDMGLALVLIVLTAPLMLIVAVLVSIDVGTPVMFWQERPGAFGRRLRVYKFRTMRSAHDANGVRIPESQRATPIGRMLRRLRLDELPQLFNI